MYRFTAETLDEWRPQARAIIACDIPPTEVSWDALSAPSLFSHQPLPPSQGVEAQVPPDFFSIARRVACHRDPRRWDLLYQLLWRLTHREKHLLRISTDPLIHALTMMEKAVRRDAHKMKAFVRFRLVEEDGDDHYIAWHRPDHRVVQLVAPFFTRRFSVMRWTLLTPDETAHWDGKALSFSPGVGAAEAPPEDATEDLWREYYRAIFNPARIKIKTMKREMPMRHWATLPETRIIASMIQEAPQRIEAMIAHTEGDGLSGSSFLPLERDIPHLRKAAAACQGCELHKMATQTVFGRGPQNAKLMIVGEQPGNDEDLQGEPFVGPSGQLLDQALEAAQLRREEIYITNAVKHFRFAYNEKYRIHKTPSRAHIHACKPWLDAEIEAIRPAAVLCLGNTAARALISPSFLMMDQRGTWSGGRPAVSGTFHPAAILRAQGPQQAALRQAFFGDISEAARLSRLL